MIERFLHWWRKWREDREANAIAEREFREWRKGEAAEELRRAIEREKKSPWPPVSHDCDGCGPSDDDQ